MEKRHILLVNPWIADFAAYDLWTKPLGLLYIGKFLRKYGYDIELLDLTDRLRWGPFDSKNNLTGRGKYHKTIIPKPEILAHVPRRFGLYGATPQQLKVSLEKARQPAVILMTSHMSYWYPGIVETVKILKTYFPQSKIILGGIYATLFPEHAKSVIKPDHLIVGYGEKQALVLLDKIASIRRDYQKIPDFDDVGMLPWDLYPELQTAGILTSRGCPLNCDYCATKFLNAQFCQRSVSDIVSEISVLYDDFKVKNVAFYDDALLTNKEKHIIPILKNIVSKNISMRFHTPNGLFARDINAELAELMFASGFKTIRLSLESIIPKFQKSSSNKVSVINFEKALFCLDAAGFQRNNIEVYLLMGLPEQRFIDVEQTLKYIAEQGAVSRLASYTPIPHTRFWEISKEMGYIHDSIDPLLTNNTLCPCANPDFPVEKFIELRQISNIMNDKLRNASPER